MSSSKKPQTGPDGKPKIPRPPNAFIIYRREHAGKYKGLGLPQSQVSQMISREWGALSDQHKAYYHRLAEEEKERHALMYPGYKFNPQSAADKAAAKEKAKLEKKAKEEEDRAAKRRRVSAGLPIATSNHAPYGSQLASTSATGFASAPSPAITEAPLSPFTEPASRLQSLSPTANFSTQPELPQFDDLAYNTHQSLLLDPALDPSSLTLPGEFESTGSLKRTFDQMEHDEFAAPEASGSSPESEIGVHATNVGGLNFGFELDPELLSMFLDEVMHGHPLTLPTSDDTPPHQSWNELVTAADFTYDEQPAPIPPFPGYESYEFSSQGQSMMSVPQENPTWDSQPQYTDVNGVFTFGQGMQSDFGFQLDPYYTPPQDVPPNANVFDQNQSDVHQATFVDEPQTDLDVSGLAASMFDFSGGQDPQADEQPVASTSSVAPAHHYTPPQGAANSHRRVGGYWQIPTSY